MLLKLKAKFPLFKLLFKSHYGELINKQEMCPALLIQNTFELFKFDKKKNV